MGRHSMYYQRIWEAVREIEGDPAGTLASMQGGSILSSDDVTRVLAGEIYQPAENVA